MQKEKNMRCLLNWHRTEVNNSSRHQRRKRSESCTLTLGRLLSTVFWEKMEIWDKGTSRTAFASNSSTLFRSHCQWPLVWCPHIYRANDSLPAIQLDNSPEGTETSFSPWFLLLLCEPWDFSFSENRILQPEGDGYDFIH